MKLSELAKTINDNTESIGAFVEGDRIICELHAGAVTVTIDGDGYIWEMNNEYNGQRFVAIGPMSVLQQLEYWHTLDYLEEDVR